MLLLINCIAFGGGFGGLRVRWNCGKGDKIASLSATGLLCLEREIFLSFEIITTILKFKGPHFFFLFLFWPHSLFGWLESCRNFPFWYLDFVIVCPRIRPEIVEELGSFWVLTCLFVSQYKKLTKYHYFLFSVKQIDIRMKLCLEFWMFVFKWQVSSIELKEKNYIIDLFLQNICSRGILCYQVNIKC